MDDDSGLRPDNTARPTAAEFRKQRSLDELDADAALSGLTQVLCVRLLEGGTTVRVVARPSDGIRACHALGFYGGGDPLPNVERGARQAWLTQTEDLEAFARLLNARIIRDD